MTITTPALDRRSLLRSAILLAGGSLAGLPSVAFAQATEQRFFDQARFALLDEVVEIMIPRTDTPGARDAGVAANFDALMANWASAAHRAEFSALIDDIDVQSGRLLSLAPEQRLAALTAYDAANMYNEASPYRRFKDLVLTLYYLSEPGATEELRYELSPGAWEASIPMTADTRTWAA